MEIDVLNTLKIVYGPPKRVPEYVRKANKKTYSLPTFDAGMIIETYKHYQWAKDIHLEKLCLFPVGFWKRLGNDRLVEGGKEEIDSINLF